MLWSFQLLQVYLVLQLVTQGERSLCRSNLISHIAGRQQFKKFSVRASP